jgi:hypothetical protein
VRGLHIYKGGFIGQGETRMVTPLGAFATCYGYGWGVYFTARMLLGKAVGFLEFTVEFMRQKRKVPPVVRR